MRFLTLFTLLIAITLHAEDHDYGPPIAVCLNKHTIPYIDSTVPAEKIVNDVYKACQGIVDEWNNEKASLLRGMVIKQDKAFRDMYTYYCSGSSGGRDFLAAEINFSICARGMFSS
ncbi:hypothetical protein [Lelliottia sp. RWM.1]|uniref:hypothetical protein n=1 Tax=Lelliottia sp. RWM.1 TaxID=2663242 RepID=UPI00193E9391|nr:hypothetical protein [Lelliottia sp. RWM.1]MBM3072762.1 hypothetical protein [Lelliottia sp. RWM.1]